MTRRIERATVVGAEGQRSPGPVDRQSFGEVRQSLDVVGISFAKTGTRARFVDRTQERVPRLRVSRHAQCNPPLLAAPDDLVRSFGTVAEDPAVVAQAA